MKILSLFVLFISGMVSVYSQSKLPLRADSVVVEKVGGNANLQVKDASRDTLGIYTNIGGGVLRAKRPRKINDSTFTIGNDTIRLARGGGSSDSLGRIYSLKQLGILDDADIRIGSTTFGTNQATQIQAVLNKALLGPITILWDVHTSIDTTLYVYSNTKIVFAPGCGVILRNGANCNVLMNKNRTTGTIVDSNIVLTGNDWIINGNGGQQIHDTEANGWVAGVRFVGANNVTVEGGSIVAARSFHLWFMNANYIKVRNLKIDYAPGYNSSQYGTFDGIHLNGPMRFIEVQNLVARVFDDAIGTNADDVWQNTDPAGVCEVCSNASSYDPWAGNGEISDFNYENITFENNCLFGLRFLSGVSPIRRGTITNLKGTTSLQVVIMDNWSEGEPAHPGVGLIEDIVFDKIYAEVEPRESYTYKNTYFSLGCKMNNITFRNVGRSLFTNGTYPTFNIDANAYIQGLTIDGLNHRGQLTADIPWIRNAGYVTNFKINNVSNSAPSTIRNNSLIKLTSTGRVKTLQLNSIHIDSSMSMIDIEDGIIDTIHATNIIHSGNGGNTWLYTESAVSRLVLSNYSGGTIYTLGTGGSVGSTSGDAFAGGSTTLNDVLLADPVSSLTASVGGLTITAASGTNRANQFSNNSASDNFATIDLRPPTGTNVASSLRMIPRGTGYTGSIRGDLQIFNTDYVADGTNWELYLQRANGTEYLNWSLANGTGVVRPIKFLTGSNTDQFTMNINGTNTMSSLAGTGTRMVTATSTGVLGTTAIPSAENLANTNLTQTANRIYNGDNKTLTFGSFSSLNINSLGTRSSRPTYGLLEFLPSTAFPLTIRSAMSKADNSADSLALSISTSEYRALIISASDATASDNPSVEIATNPSLIRMKAATIHLQATTAAAADSAYAPGTYDAANLTNPIQKVPMQRTYRGTINWTPGVVAAGSSTSTTITVTGAVVGDPVVVSKKSGQSNGEIYDGQVTAPNTVTLRVHNVSTGSANYSSAADYNVIVFKY